MSSGLLLPIETSTGGRARPAADGKMRWRRGRAPITARFRPDVLLESPPASDSAARPPAMRDFHRAERERLRPPLSGAMASSEHTCTYGYTTRAPSIALFLPTADLSTMHDIDHLARTRT